MHIPHVVNDISNHFRGALPELLDQQATSIAPHGEDALAY